MPRTRNETENFLAYLAWILVHEASVLLSCKRIGLAESTVAANTVTSKNIPSEATKDTGSGCTSTSSVRIKISAASTVAVCALTTSSSKSIVISCGREPNGVNQKGWIL